MDFKKYIFIIFISTVFSLTSFILVINKVDPINTPIFGFIWFYVSLFLSSIGILSLLSILIRWLFLSRQITPVIVLKSFRQSILFSVVVISFFILKSFDVLKIWNLGIIVVAVIITEFLFLSHKPGRKIV